MMLASALSDNRFPQTNCDLQTVLWLKSPLQIPAEERSVCQRAGLLTALVSATRFNAPPSPADLGEELWGGKASGLGKEGWERRMLSRQKPLLTINSDQSVDSW